MVVAFSWDISWPFFVLFLPDTYPYSWNDLECYSWWQTSALLSRGRILPRTTLLDDLNQISPLCLLTRFLIKVFTRPWIGPLAQYIHKYGLRGLTPLQIEFQDFESQISYLTIWDFTSWLQLIWIHKQRFMMFTLYQDRNWFSVSA